MATPPNQWATQDADVQRAASARRLKSAQRSMVMSAVVTLILLAVTVTAFLNGHFSAQQNGQTTALMVFALIILLRFGYRGYRLYTTWRNLKDAQEAHRNLG